MDNLRKYHMAVCSSCRHCEESDKTDKFISEFFLPDMCPSCGETMHGWSFVSRDEKPHWRHVIVKYKRIPANRSAWRPWTWFYFDGWDSEEISEFRA